MYCVKHPREKMTLLFNSYVCDICSPPKNQVQPAKKASEYWWEDIGFTTVPVIMNTVVGIQHVFNSAAVLLELPAVYDYVDGSFVEMTVFKNTFKSPGDIVRVPKFELDFMRSYLFEWNTSNGTHYLVALAE